MPKVMARPHRQNQSHIPNSINGKHFDRIARRKDVFAVEGHQQKGRYPQHFPTNKEGFEITCEYRQVKPQVKEEHCVEKPLVSRLSV